MKKLTASIFSAVLMLSMVFSSSVFAANDATSTKASAWESFLGLFSKTTATATTANVQYRGHVQDYGDVPTNGTWVQEDNQLGTTGESKRIEGFKIELTDGNTLPAGTQIRYNVHVENEGWLHDKNDIVNTGSWEKDGAFAGSVAKSQRVEAIEIVLTDANGVKLQGYSVQYMVHGEDYGWSQGWVADGAIAGTEGQSKRLEAIRIKITQLKADLTAYNAALAAVNQADYTTASWTTYQAVVNANKVTEDNTQTQVNTATANITAAQGNLVLIPKVASVTAINANQVQVTFNKAIDKNTVINGTDTLVSNVISVTRTTTGDSPAAGVITSATDLSTITGTKAKLSADGTQLTITVGNDNFFKGTYDASVKNVVSSGVTVNSYLGNFTIDDKTSPTVLSAVYKPSTDKFVFEISEPINSVANGVVTINGVPATLDTITTKPSTTLTVSRPASLAFGTTATVYVAGFSDIAGNLVTPSTNQVAVTKDETALDVTSVAQVSNKVVRVTFNKKLNATSDAAIKLQTGLVVSTKTGAATSDYTVQSAPSAVNVDGNVYDFTLNYVDYTAANTYATAISFVKDAFTDVTGNKNPLITKSITMNKDTVRPTVVSSNISADGKAIEVVFSEEVTSLDTATPKVLLRKDGTEQSLTAAISAGRVYLKDGVSIKNSVLVVQPTTDVLTAGTYQVRLLEGAVTDINANQILTVNAPSVVATGTVAAKDTIVTSTDYSNRISIAPPSGETFTTASANVANFMINGVAIPAASDVVINSGSIVVTLPPTESVKYDGDSLFTSSNVALVSGAALNQPTKTVKLADNTAPVLQSAKVIDSTKILATYSEDLNAALATAKNVSGEFVINVGGSDLTIAASELTAVKSTGVNNQVLLTLNKTTSPISASVSAVTKTGTGTATLSTGGTYTGSVDAGYKVVVKTLNATKPATVTIYKDNVVVADDVAITPGSALSNASLQGITVTITDEASVVGDSFTFTATAAVASAPVTLDLNKTITIKTLAGTNMADASQANGGAGNAQKEATSAIVTTR